VRERGVVDLIDFIVEEGEPGLVVEQGLLHLDEEMLVELVVLLQEVPNHNDQSAAIFFFYAVSGDGGAGVEHESDEVFDELSLFEYPACG
jgi:D-ribose pyranose/furanose isomerase RbsD